MPLPSDFAAELRKHFNGEIRADPASRILYSTDASIYQIEPLGVAVPRTQDDLQAAVELAAKYKLPILPRGSGTSLAGQAIGAALILDCSRWLDRIVGIDSESRTAVVEPGVILSKLNKAAAGHGLQFGPDPASAERATMGGVIGNNATGAHSILYGMTADHLLQADVLFSDGSLSTLGVVDAAAPGRDVRENTAGGPSSRQRYAQFESAALQIREKAREAIKSHWPGTWRNSAGYRLNYLLPWSPSAPPQWTEDHYPPVKPGALNLAALLAGSEGTLAVIRRATVNLVPKPKYTILGALAYVSIAGACEAVPALLQHNPSAIELIPQMLIRLARGVPAFAAQMGWVSGDPVAVLVVEFSGNDPEALKAALGKVSGVMAIAETPEQQARVWNVRRVGLGLLDSRPQSARPIAFIEDCAIPVERLGEFVREVERVLADHGVEGGIYAHASGGCLHIRPILDLKSASAVSHMRQIAKSVLDLTLSLGGSMSSEHGDGLARGEWLERIYGPELLDAMRGLKQAADPQHLLNPGKIPDAPRMDKDLRFGSDYSAAGWKPGLGFEGSGGLVTAIEQCNGQGVCRKTDGLMCPSFQATRDEMHSTRGRANLLRALISQGARGIPQSTRHRREMTEAVAGALDLCLACKGCKAECPSGVDMAKLKFAFDAEYYKSHRRPLRDYVFGYFHVVAGALATIAPIANRAMHNSLLRRMAARILGITPRRPFPNFARRRASIHPVDTDRRRSVIFLPDAYTRYVEPEVEQAAFDLLGNLGYPIRILPIVGAGAALMSKGFLAGARRHAGMVLDRLARYDPQGVMPIVGIEPPEIYALKHDYFDLLPERKEEISIRSRNTWLLDEFLVRGDIQASLRVATNNGQILFQPHCHQRAEDPAPDGLPNGTRATMELLRISGYEVDLIEAGCCGMAGTFGYETEHYQLSQQVGELKLFPRVRQKGDALIASSGAACRMQIEQGAGAPVEHPIVLAARAILGN